MQYTYLRAEDLVGRLDRFRKLRACRWNNLQFSRRRCILSRIWFWACRWVWTLTIYTQRQTGCARPDKHQDASNGVPICSLPADRSSSSVRSPRETMP